MSHAHAMRASFRASQCRGDVNGKWQVVSSKGESSGKGLPCVYARCCKSRRRGGSAEAAALRHWPLTTRHSPFSAEMSVSDATVTVFVLERDETFGLGPCGRGQALCCD